ncbi:MAG: GHMP kinase [Desulfurococcaceae archaeon]|jgi:beta-ribofuranosylaminobenzene 5'-phosphate synthase
MPKRVVVESPARLHFGVVNPFNNEYRLYVSAGVAISRPKTRVVTYPDRGLHIEGCRSEELLKRLEPLIDALKLKKGHVIVEECAPTHVGLGSTTQLLLSAARALLIANEITNVSIVDIAKLLKLGRVSGVGTYVHMYGGFVVDAGRKHQTDFPKLLLRLPFPEEWRFVVIIPKGKGLDEHLEYQIFETARPAAPEVVWRASFMLFHELVPAIIEQDFDAFSKALSELQRTVGLMFREYQGGVFAHYSNVAIDALLSAGVVGVGQSSWGPAVYGVVRGAERAHSIASSIKALLSDSEVFVADPDNRGAVVKIELVD